jgi:aminopeptidase N
VPGENLTRAEAIERAGVVTAVDSYAIDLDLTTGPTTFSSTTVIRFSATAGASTFVDLVAPSVREVVLNGRSLDVAQLFADSRIALDGLEAENELTVVADCAYTNTGEGLHRFVDPVDGEVYLYTQFEVPDARRVFATFEQPDLKATFQVTVTAPAAWQVVSNQPTPEPAPAQHASEPGAEAATWRFEPTPRISSYLVALVAGPYAVQRGELTSSDGRTIPLGVFCRASLSEHLDADYIMETTRKGFAYFEKTFDFPYPFAKYDQLFVPEYNMGAMENPGCVTFTESYVFRSKVTDAVRERRVVTILHELAHMWFGDLVTMKWWNDLWLNESFAEYVSTLATAEATEWEAAWTTFSAMEKTWAYRQDQLPSTHPIVAPINDLEDVQVNFDGITYAKGASVLKQLVAWVGREEFLAGVAAYFTKHAWSNTELADLLTELEATSGRDLASWSKLWLETAGVNTLRPDVVTDADGRITGFAVLQSAPADHPTIRPHRLGIGFYDLVDGALVRTHAVQVDVDGERTEIPSLVGRERPGLILLNDEDLAYAKIRLDEASLAFAIEHLSRIADPLARSLVWGSAWDAVRDGETPASSYVDLVLGNIAAETESTTVRTTLAQLGLAARRYVAPSRRAETLARVGDTLWSLAQEAAAGSDLQLQLVKYFALLASTDEHVAPLRGLVDGTVTLEGLEIDTDLRWELLEGLVILGAAGEDEIASTLTQDDTATGRQAAARARAAIPTVEGKERAFASIVEQADVPNAIIRSTAAGFVHVGAHASVLEPLVGRYVDALLPIWESRSYHISEELIEGLYPAPLASEGLRDAVRGWLDANTDAPAALRRMVSEQLADTERALAAQAADA